VLCIPFGTAGCDGEAFPVTVECSPRLRTSPTCPPDQALPLLLPPGEKPSLYKHVMLRSEWLVFCGCVSPGHLGHVIVSARKCQHSLCCGACLYALCPLAPSSAHRPTTSSVLCAAAASVRISESGCRCVRHALSLLASTVASFASHSPAATT
jgi:hypothetical protein